MAIVCIDYGAGNLKSIVNGFRKAYVKVVLADEYKKLKAAIDAGADIIVTGTIAERDLKRLKEIVKAVKG